MLPARVYQAARWVSRVVEVRNERVTGHGMPGGSLGPRGSEFRVIIYRLRLIGVGVAKESCPGHRCSLTYTGAFAKSRRSPVWLGQDAQSLAVAGYAPSLSLGFRVQQNPHARD